MFRLDYCWVHNLLSGYSWLSQRVMYWRLEEVACLPVCYVVLPTRSKSLSLVGKGKVRSQPMKAQHPYHLTLRTQGLLPLPPRDPAEVGGLAAQCGAMGRAVAEGGVAALA